ncbi:MAG: flagellar filament capping protein FliD [Bacillota bacterium]
MDLGITGIDIDQQINKILNSEFSTKYENLNQEQSDLETTKDTWRDVNSRLSKLSNGISDLNFSSTFNSNVVSSSDESVVTATANSDAVANDYNINVSNLAQTHRVVSDDQGGADTELGLNAGEFSLDIDGKTITVGDEGDIDNTTTLNELVEQVNSDSDNYDDSGNQLIKASAVDNKLVLESAQTGTSNSISINDDPNGILDQLGLTDFSTDLSDGGDRVQQAENAQFTVDGVEVTRESNTEIDDVIDNLTFDLHSSGSSNLSVSPDTDKAVSAVQEFVDQYNSTMEFINDKSNYDEESEEADALQGDSTLMRLASNLRQTITSDVDTNNKYNNLSLVGIEIDRSGEMSFDQDKFKAALDEAPGEVRELFNASEDDQGFAGVATKLDNYVNDLVQTGGIIPERIDMYENRIQSAKDEMDSLEDRLSSRKETLEEEFNAMQSSIAELNNQSSNMNSMLGNMGGGSISTLLGSL